MKIGVFGRVTVMAGLTTMLLGCGAGSGTEALPPAINAAGSQVAAGAQAEANVGPALAGEPTGIVPVEVTRAPTVTYNVDLTADFGCDVSTSYFLCIQSRDLIADGLEAAVRGGACGMTIFPIAIRSISYGPPALAEPVVIPACPAAPARPRIESAPVRRDPAKVCTNAYAADCPVEVAHQDDAALITWDKKRDGLVRQYDEAVKRYEVEVATIREATNNQIAQFRAWAPVPDNDGTDLRGAWLFASRVFENEARLHPTRHFAVWAATDGYAEGVQSEGVIALRGAVVTILNWTCSLAAQCEQLRTDVSGELKIGGASSVEWLTAPETTARKGVLLGINLVPGK